MRTVSWLDQLISNGAFRALCTALARAGIVISLAGSVLEFRQQSLRVAFVTHLAAERSEFISCLLPLA